MTASKENPWTQWCKTNKNVFKRHTNIFLALIVYGLKKNLYTCTVYLCCLHKEKKTGTATYSSIMKKKQMKKKAQSVPVFLKELNMTASKENPWTQWCKTNKMCLKDTQIFS